MTTKRPYIPQGIDLQGRVQSGVILDQYGNRQPLRIPQPRKDDEYSLRARKPIPEDLNAFCGIFWWALAALSGWFIVIMALLAVFA